MNLLATANASPYEQGQQLGLPVVYGEWAHEGGYHYYPDIVQVKRWLDETHLRILDETVGDAYHHFIVSQRSRSRKAASS